MDNFIKKYKDSLQSVKEKLTEYISEKIECIDLPDNVNLPTTSIKHTGNSVPQKPVVYGVAAGVVLFLSGLIAKEKLLWISGLVLFATASWFKLSHRPQSHSEVRSSSVDFENLSKSVYRKLQAINTYMSDEWERSVTVYKDAIKSDIWNLETDQAKKNRMTELAMKRSVVSVSMLDILSVMNRLCMGKDISAYRPYLETVKSVFISALETAYNEQKAVYDDIVKVME